MTYTYDAENNRIAMKNERYKEIYVINTAKYIETKILTQDLSSSDKALAKRLLEDLYDALGR